MRPIRLLLALVAAVATTLGVVAINAPAYGLSCVDPGSLAQRATSVFTGTIIDARDGRLRVEVQEIWKGEPVGQNVWVDLDPSLQGWWDELPSHNFPQGYSSTKPWVFMPRAEDGKAMVVNTCTAGILSGPWSIGVERPDTVTQPVAEEATKPVSAPVEPARENSDPGWLIGGAVALALVVGAAAYRLVRRRSS